MWEKDMCIVLYTFFILRECLYQSTCGLGSESNWNPLLAYIIFRSSKEKVYINTPLFYLV